MKTFYILVVLLLISGCIDNKNESLSKTTTPAATITETAIATDVATPAAIATDVATPAAIATDVATPAASVNETESVKDTETVVATDVATPAASVNETGSVEATETVIVGDIVQYDIGQSADNGNTKIVLNGIRFAESIDDTKIIPELGNQFLIVNISIKNIGNESSLYHEDQFVILYEGGNMETIYTVDVLGSSNLFHRFDGENIEPGEERKGELAYQVPKNAKGLKLKFEYSDSTSEIFSLN